MSFDKDLDKLGRIRAGYAKRHGLSSASASSTMQIHYLGMRDGWSCEYCGVELTTKTNPNGTVLAGKRFATRDHIIPTALGGANTLFNMVLACGPCNRRKGIRDPRVAFATEGGA